jgi:hypothetical protein
MMWSIEVSLDEFIYTEEEGEVRGCCLYMNRGTGKTKEHCSASPAKLPRIKEINYLWIGPFTLKQQQ